MNQNLVTAVLMFGVVWLALYGVLDAARKRLVGQAALGVIIAGVFAVLCMDRLLAGIFDGIAHSLIP